MPRQPRILITVHGPAQAALEEPAWRTFDTYADAVRRAGGEPVLIDPMVGAEERVTAFAEMDGLLLPGGADVDPGRYGEAPAERTQAEPPRDALEAAAWSAAADRGVPVLGVCRGMQAINVFSGGSLIQHLQGHESPMWPSPDSHPHPLRLVVGSRLAAILGTQHDALEVNSYHHQGLRPDQLGAGLTVSATTADGELVEALEASDPERWVFGVQNHPERPEFTPPAFARLWRAFVEAAGG